MQNITVGYLSGNGLLYVQYKASHEMQQSDTGTLTKNCCTISIFIYVWQF